MKRVAVCALLVALGGCQSNDNLFTGPTLTPVGTGLSVAHAPLPVGFAAPPPASFNSIAGTPGKTLLSDVRAGTIGDTLTVLIDLNDSARFDNQTSRSRGTGIDVNAQGELKGNDFQGLGGDAKGLASLGLGDKSTYAGQGTIDRSEHLRLSIAAVVTDVLPNGNLLISGTQEIRVNNEVRVLHLAGIVHPADISPANTITYDRIAEARISYSGRGRLNDVQRPPWGQLIYDTIAPF